MRQKISYFLFSFCLATEIPYILIEEHLKRCNLNFILIKIGPNA